MKETKFLKGSENEKIDAIKEALIEKSRIDLGDYFEFLITGPKMELEAAPYGGARFQIEPHDELELKNYLDFAGFEAPKIGVINVEQHFAEKIHAYTLPRESENSRVKDLVDLYLIVKNEKLDTELLKQCLKDTFSRRDTHVFSAELKDPPVSWEKPFKNFELGIEMEDCFKLVVSFVKSLSWRE